MQFFETAWTLAKNEINSSPHKPVLLQRFLEMVKPVAGTWIDCTFGAGGYSKALIESGADLVIGIDCDPESQIYVKSILDDATNKFKFCLSRFGAFDQLPPIVDMAPVQGVVFDLGASSMQFDHADRGFSFQYDGPLDMRMEKKGVSAAVIVNHASERALAKLFRVFGEEIHNRRIARVIVQSRCDEPITSTSQLATIVEKAIPRRNFRRNHPATKVFQALRIAVNDELRQLAEGLSAAERVLCDGGVLAVVSFHSLEDRIVKRFVRGGIKPTKNRHDPHLSSSEESRFKSINKRPIRPDETEITTNPRSRSAKMRVALRNSNPSIAMNFEQLGVPQLNWQELN